MGEGKSFMVGGVNGMGESRFYDGWRGWGKESRLGWVALMGWEKESRFYGGWRGWDGGKKSFMVGGVNGMGERKSFLWWMAGMGWEKESRFYGGWRGWDGGRKSF